MRFGYLLFTLSLVYSSAKEPTNDENKTTVVDTAKVEGTDDVVSETEKKVESLTVTEKEEPTAATEGEKETVAEVKEEDASLDPTEGEGAESTTEGEGDCVPPVCSNGMPNKYEEENPPTEGERLI